MKKLKELLSKWKVHISVVGGALVIATAYGQCTVEPDLDVLEESAEEATETSATTPASDDDASSTNTSETTVESSDD